MRTYLILAGLLAMAGGAWSLPACGQDTPAVTPEVAAVQDSLQKLRREISTINLLNGLNLTKDQQLKLRALSQSYATAIAAPAVSKDLETLKTAQASLVSLRTEIQKGDPARGAIPSAAAKIEEELKAAKEKVQLDSAAKIQAIDAELNKMLTPGQLEVIEAYKACLIPPENLKNPVRAGQAADSGPQIRMLRNLRKLPDNQYVEARNKAIADALTKVEQHQLRLTDAEKKQLTSRMKEVSDKAKRMTDTRFEVEKDNLAQMLQMDEFVAQVRKSMAERDPHYATKPQLSKAGRFLLTPETAAIMEERINPQPVVVAGK